jgi:WD40 repeat protein
MVPINPQGDAGLDETTEHVYADADLDIAEVGGSWDVAVNGPDEGGGTDSEPSVGFESCRILGLGFPSAMDVSSDGTLAAYGSREGGITLVRLSDMLPVRTITAHSAEVTAVAFSPDQTQLISGDRTGVLAVWDRTSGDLIWRTTLGSSAVLALDKSASKKPVWALAADGVRQIDLSAQAVSTPAAGTSACSSMAVMPEGGSLALGCNDGLLRIVDVTTWFSTVTVAAHTGGVTAVCPAGDGSVVVTGGADGTVALWSLQGALVRRFAKPGSAVSSVDVTADGTLIAVAAAATGYAGVWKASDGSEIIAYGVFNYHARFTVDGKAMLAMASNPTVVRFPLDGSRTSGWSDPWVAAEFSPDGDWLAESGMQSVVVWNTRDGSVVKMLSDSNVLSSADALAFSADGRWLARNTVDNRLRVFDTASGGVSLRVSDVPDSRSLFFTPDQAWLATPAQTGVGEWSVGDGSRRTVAAAAGGAAATAMAFSGDGSLLAVGDSAGTIALWDGSGSTLLRTWNTGTPLVSAIAFSPDGKRLAVGNAAAQGGLWSTGGVRIATLPLANEPAFSFSSDGKWLAALAPAVLGNAGTFYDQAIVVVSATDGNSLTIVDQQPNKVGGQTTVRFAPDGNRLAFTGNGWARIVCPR